MPSSQGPLVRSQPGRPLSVVLSFARYLTPLPVSGSRFADNGQRTTVTRVSCARLADRDGPTDSAPRSRKSWPPPRPTWPSTQRSAYIPPVESDTAPYFTPP